MNCIVVMPTYNERPNIAAVIAAVLANGPEWRVLVVDDNSPDGTGQVVDQLAAAEPRIRVLHRAGKLGLGTAYRDGLTLALKSKGGVAQPPSAVSNVAEAPSPRNGQPGAAVPHFFDSPADYICTMDSDFSHNPAVLPELRRLAEAHGAAHGSRYVAGGAVQDWGLTRKFNSAVANILTRLLFGVNLRDCTSGFRCYRRDVLERLEVATLTARGYAVLEELLYRCSRIGVKPAEFPITFVDRKAGESKINAGESFRGLTMLLKLKLRGWRARG